MNINIFQELLRLRSRFGFRDEQGNKSSKRLAGLNQPPFFNTPPPRAAGPV